MQDFNLIDLPRLALERIMFFLPDKDLNNMKLVNKNFNSLSLDSQLMAKKWELTDYLPLIDHILPGIFNRSADIKKPFSALPYHTKLEYLRLFKPTTDINFKTLSKWCDESEQKNTLQSFMYWFKKTEANEELISVETILELLLQTDKTLALKEYYISTEIESGIRAFCCCLGLSSVHESIRNESFQLIVNIAESNDTPFEEKKYFLECLMDNFITTSFCYDKNIFNQLFEQAQFLLNLEKESYICKNSSFACLFDVSDLNMDKIIYFAQDYFVLKAHEKEIVEYLTICDKSIYDLVFAREKFFARYDNFDIEATYGLTNISYGIKLSYLLDVIKEHTITNNCLTELSEDNIQNLFKYYDSSSTTWNNLLFKIKDKFSAKIGYQLQLTEIDLGKYPEKNGKQIAYELMESAKLTNTPVLVKFINENQQSYFICGRTLVLDKKIEMIGWKFQELNNSLLLYDFFNKFKQSTITISPIEHPEIYNQFAKSKLHYEAETNIFFDRMNLATALHMNKQGFLASKKESAFFIHFINQKPKACTSIKALYTVFSGCENLDALDLKSFVKNCIKKNEVFEFSDPSSSNLFPKPKAKPENLTPEAKELLTLMYQKMNNKQKEKMSELMLNKYDSLKFFVEFLKTIDLNLKESVNSYQPLNFN